MILDTLNEFCAATALNTGGAGSYLLGDQIDLGAAQRSIGGDGTALYLVIQVATLPTSGGAATAAFSLASDATASIAVDGSQTEHFRTRAFTIAQMAAGTVLAAIQLPGEGPLYERFLGIVQTTAAAAFTGGAINAFLTTDVARWKAYDAPWQL